MVSRMVWLIHKDLVVEYRSRVAWPTMLVLGVLVAVVFSLQLEGTGSQKNAVSAAILWLAVLFAGLVIFERSCGVEERDGCWDALNAYPLSPALIYLAKWLSNVIAILALECLLVPLFVVLLDVPLLRTLWPMVLVAGLAGMGMAAIGTLVSALTHGLRQHGSVLALLMLPLVIPVLLAAGEATRLIVEADLGAAWLRWVQFLGGYAVIFVSLGMLLFGVLVEE